MRYLFIVLLATWLSPMQAIAENNPSAEAAAQKENVVVGYLYKTAGEVAVSLNGPVTQDGLMTEAVSTGATLKNDTTISTGENSWAVLKFNDDQIIVLQASSSFRILDYHYNPKEAGKGKLFFYLLQGGLRAITGSIGRAHPAAFRLETHDVSVGISDADFFLVMDNQVYLQATSGSITMGNIAGNVALGAGQSAVVASANTLPALIAADELPDGIFSKLNGISVPDPKPIEPSQPGVAPAPVAAPTEIKPLWASHAKPPEIDAVEAAEIKARKEAEAKARKDAEDEAVRINCEKKGLKPGAIDYLLCLEYRGKGPHVDNSRKGY